MHFVRKNSFGIVAVALAVFVVAMSAPAHAQPSNELPKHVTDFLATHCVSCHGPEKKKADLTLHQYKDAKSVLKDRKKWDAVLKLIHSGEMPPDGRRKPKMEEIEGVMKSVQAIFDFADKNAKPDPGHVTMRRLNRTEYANTIRDLIGVDFDPTEGFPSDDVGYGFDNIGDVLTISPTLMERYLVAAEAITARAIIVGDPPKPNVRVMSARFLEPALQNPGEMKWRPISKAGEHLHTPYILNEAGEYKIRVRVYTEFPKKDGEKKSAKLDPTKIHLTLATAPIKTVDVKSQSSDKGEVIEHRLTLKKGINRVGVRLVNGAEDGKPKDRILYVRNIELEGPLDTMPLVHRKLMAHREGASKDEAAREILGRLATKAFRRPVTSQEVDRLVKFVKDTEKDGQRWEKGIQMAVQAILCSPKFLFRVELDHRPAADGIRPLDDYQLASRLSYFLWSTMPDEELFAEAAKGQLHVNLATQVRRMLKDEKAKALPQNFMPQWLQLHPLKNFSPDRKVFPEWDEKLRAAMFKETELFFDHLMRENRSLLELVESDYTFLNERLARHYGIVDTNGNRAFQKVASKKGEVIRGEPFVKVTFADKERGGILTQASVLAVNSNPTRTSPVKRGRWILEQILGTPPPPPPGPVPELDEQKELKGSLRERMEQHRKNPACANCHAKMDAVGFAFENFDAVGKYREKDEGHKIDPLGELPGGVKFAGAPGLKQYLLSQKDLFGRCLVEKMLTYSIGRGLEYYDKRAVDKIMTALERDEYRFSTLVVEICQSDPFRLRRGKDGQP